MNHFTSLLLISLILFSCEAQQKERKVGGPCEGCEALLENADELLNSIDTLPGFNETEPKLHLFGQVYEKDGQTPAKNIIIYIYHTNREGIYEKEVNASGWATSHGKYRGWVKTNEDGRYDFYTFRPASYPKSTIPQHIHLTVKEPGTNSYYIDAVEFTEDPYLTKQEIASKSNRGGSGIVRPVYSDSTGLIKVRRDIILGMNIPDY